MHIETSDRKADDTTVIEETSSRLHAEVAHMTFPVCSNSTALTDCSAYLTALKLNVDLITQQAANDGLG
jgi:hypothetical protein